MSYITGLKLNTRVIAGDGRIGTICYDHLDGCGGVWGEHEFAMPAGGFGDLPMPQFLLRSKADEPLMRRFHGPEIECVEEYQFPPDDDE